MVSWFFFNSRVVEGFVYGWERERVRLVDFEGFFWDFEFLLFLVRGLEDIYGVCVVFIVVWDLYKVG